MSHCKWLQWMHVFFLKMTVHYMLVSHALQQFCNLHKPKKGAVNNCIAKCRLGAWDTQELPLLAASSYMETVPMAGKSWWPSREESRHPSHWEHQWKKGRERGGKKPLKNWVPTYVIYPHWIKHTKSCWTHQEGWTLNALDNAKMHTGPTAWCILVFDILHTPLASKVTQALLAVNSVKLHLTALN